MESRENNTPDKNGLPRSVKFNPETMETSIGGTLTSGRIQLNESSILSTSSASFLQSPEHSKTIPTVQVNLETAPVLQKINLYNGNTWNENRTVKTPLKVTHPPVVVDKSLTTPNKFDRRHTLDQVIGTPDCYNIVSFETPIAKGKHHRSFSHDLDSLDDDAGSSVTVAVRVRPFMTRLVF